MPLRQDVFVFLPSLHTLRFVVVRVFFYNVREFLLQIAAIDMLSRHFKEGPLLHLGHALPLAVDKSLNLLARGLLNHFAVLGFQRIIDLLKVERERRRTINRKLRLPR